MKVPFIRFRLRFGLRALLAAVTIIALLLGWHMYRVVREREALTIVRTLGGQVYFDYQRRTDVTNGTFIVSKAIPHGPQWLRDWIGPEHFDSVVSVSFRDKQITAEHLRQLVKFTKLDHLELAHTPITNDDLRELAPLTNLKVLNLSYTAIDGTGIKHIAHLKQLEWLTVWHTPFGDEGMPYMAGFTNLKNLSLDSTRITDRGTIHLAGLTQMDGWLGLAETSITDASLVHFRNLTRLHKLNLIRSRVTREGWLKLQQSLPKVEVDFFSVGPGPPPRRSASPRFGKTSRPPRCLVNFLPK